MARLRVALSGLSPERRALLAMFYLEEMSTAAIGRALGIPNGTVKSRLHHARNELKETLTRSKS